jgi:N-acetylglucosamine-6-phosphate deacetylase
LKDLNRPQSVLQNVRVVLPQRTIERADLLIQGDRIARITEFASDTSSVETALELEGLTLFPGFIDLHIHGAVGVDTMAASVADLTRVSEFLATQGVTAWLPTLVPSPHDDYTRAIGAIAEAMTSTEYLAGARRAVPLQAEKQQSSTAGSHQRIGARILGAHFEGPFVNTGQCGALRSEYFKKYSRPSEFNLDSLSQVGSALRMMTLAPEIEGGIDLITDLVRRGWVASIGHTQATVQVLDRAFAAGARHMTHFMNAMAPFNHRAPGPVGWGLARDDATCDFIADGIHIDNFVLRLLMKAKSANRLLLISDAIAAAGKGDGEYKIWGETISVKNRRTSNSRGSIAGSVITMLDAVRTMLSLGASENDVSRMASTNPARLLRCENDCGAIEEGKRADLVALDPDGNVRLTVIGGSIAFQRPGLH